MMNFEEFGNSVAENIKSYLPEEYADALVSMQEVIKNNDTKRIGLMIRFNDSIITSNIYLESYFGFPRKKRDSDENYTVTLKRGERQPDGTYKDIIKEISSEELVAVIKKAKEMQESKLELEVSEKLLRNFNSHDGKALISLSVPVHDAEQQKDVFYNIVIPESNTSDAERKGYKKVSISADYDYTAKRSVPDESADGGYKDMELKISGAEIKEAFAASKDRYAERKASEDMQAAHGHQEGNYRPHNRRGR